MKANEAPEKFYLHVRANKELVTTWHGKKITNSDIEYTRTDAFIEKIQEELDNLYYKWFDDSTGMEVSEDGAEIGALDMAYEAFQEIINSLKNKK